MAAVVNSIIANSAVPRPKKGRRWFFFRPARFVGRAQGRLQLPDAPPDRIFGGAARQHHEVGDEVAAFLQTEARDEPVQRFQHGLGGRPRAFDGPGRPCHKRRMGYV
jgi:hypothetical protein